MMNSGCGNAYMLRLAPHLLALINIWERKFCISIFGRDYFIFGSKCFIFGCKYYYLRGNIFMIFPSHNIASSFDILRHHSILFLRNLKKSKIYARKGNIYLANIYIATQYLHVYIKLQEYPIAPLSFCHQKF